METNTDYHREEDDGKKRSWPGGGQERGHTPILSSQVQRPPLQSQWQESAAFVVLGVHLRQTSCPKTPFRMFTHSKFQRRFVRSLSFLRCNFEGSDHHRRQVFARSASEQLQVIHCPVGKASPKSVIILRSLTKRIQAA